MHDVSNNDLLGKIPPRVIGSVAIMMFLMVIIRCFVLVYWRQIQVDYIAYLDVSMNLLLGNDPYDLKNSLFRQWEEPPIPFPGYMLIYAAPSLLLYCLPFTHALVLALHLLLQFLVLSTVCLWTGQRLGWLRTWSDIMAPGPRQLGMSFLFCIICNSSPVLMALRHGQSAILIAGAILYTVWYQGKASVMPPILFGIAAVLKYSMVPFLGFLFLVKRKIKLCLWGAAVFFFFAASPLLTGNNLVGLYRQYVDILKMSMQKGSFNSYALSGYNMIHIGFFKLDVMNKLLIAFFLFLFILVLFRACKNSRLRDETVFFVLCVTMLPTYHRFYDLTVVVPFVCLVTCQALQAKRPRMAIPGLAIIGYVLLPMSLLNNLSGKIGPYCEKIIYTSSSMGVTNIFPLQAIVMIFITCWAFCLCWITPPNSSSYNNKGDVQ